jgi:hypothetical protein
MEMAYVKPFNEYKKSLCAVLCCCLGFVEFDGGGPELFATYFTLHCSRPTGFRKGIILTLNSGGLWQQIKDTISVKIPYEEKRMIINFSKWQ